MIPNLIKFYLKIPSDIKTLSHPTRQSISVVISKQLFQILFLLI